MMSLLTGQSRNYFHVYTGQHANSYFCAGPRHPNHIQYCRAATPHPQRHGRHLTMVIEVPHQS